MNKAEHWICSSHYKQNIKQVYNDIKRGCDTASNERETASCFENELYFCIRKNTGISPKFESEKPLNGIIHSFGQLANRKSGRGRIDSVVNNLIIEYKHKSKLEAPKDIETAKNQVIDYLLAVYKNTLEDCCAILTDGIHIQYFIQTAGEIESSLLREIGEKDVDTIIQSILFNEKKKIVASNVIKDFVVSGHSISDSRELARVLFKKIKSSRSTKTKMLFAEWMNLMHLSLNDNGKSSDIMKRRDDLSKIFGFTIEQPKTEYQALYALQTTYAIIVKVFACKIIDKVTENSTVENDFYKMLLSNTNELREIFEVIEDGYSYWPLKIYNFLEGDFFSWYVNSEIWDDNIYRYIKNILKTIDDYSTSNISIKYNPSDVFKDLYMCIIPQSVRHSMGEYFTPEWLADSVISRSLELINIQNDNTNSWKAIDPCCGSGIFIVAAIKKIVGDVAVCDLSEQQKHELVNDILRRVYGIDINPLSVLSARVSYFLAIQQLCDVTDIEIPIYLGDSAILPNVVTIDDIDCYTYSIINKCKTINVTLPVSYVKESIFGKRMNNLQQYVKVDNPETLYLQIVNDFTEEQRSSKLLCKKIKELSETLVFLHTQNWDGIWIRIVSNFMYIARLESFDMIIGNPPWVKWEHLPAEYARKIKKVCDIRHMFCNDGMYGGAQLNICALISSVTASRWLKETGILAFLMPDSIMAQNSYEEFRNFYIDYTKQTRLYLQTADRWFAPIRPFKVGNKAVTQDFLSYFWGYSIKDYKNDGVQIREIKKKDKIRDFEINSKNTWSEASELLSISYGIAKTLSSSTAFTYIDKNSDFSIITGETSYLYRTGVESTPFEGSRAKPCV